MPATSATGTSHTMQGILASAGPMQLGVTCAAATALPSIPVGATYVVIQPLSKGIRWRDDGSDPTASVGMEVAAGQSLPYSGPLSAFRFIEEAASASVNIAYYK